MYLYYLPKYYLVLVYICLLCMLPLVYHIVIISILPLVFFALYSIAVFWAPTVCLLSWCCCGTPLVSSAVLKRLVVR